VGDEGAIDENVHLVKPSATKDAYPTN